MNTMNRIMSAFLLTAAVCMPAMSQTVTVFQKNGETVKYKVSDVEKIVFEGEKPVDETNLLSEKYVPCMGRITKRFFNGDGQNGESCLFIGSYKRRSERGK